MYIPRVTHSEEYKQENVFPFIDPFIVHYEQHKQKTSNSNLHNKDSETNTDSDGMLFNTKMDQETKFSYHTRSRSKIDRMSIEEKVSKEMFEKKPLPFDEVYSTQQNLKDVLAVNLKKRSGYRTSAQVELVDIFPTLAEAAGLPLLPVCPEDTFHTMLCTEGASLMPLILNVTAANTNDVMTSKVFPVYNTSRSHNNNNFFAHRSNIKDADTKLYKLAKECDPKFQIPQKNASNLSWKKAVFSQYPRPSVEPREDSDKPHLKNIRIMGYSMWTPQFHYTEWVKFDPKSYRIHWTKRYGVELYISELDKYEMNNVALFEQCAPLADALSKRLHSGWRIAQPKQLF